jgi:hypothetical protein
MSPRALAVLLLALAAACSEDKSFVVVSVLSPIHPIANVAQLRVNVTDGQYSEQLLYPETPRAATDLLQLDPNTPVTFSVSFRATFKADVTFDVEALDRTPAPLGRGTSAAQSLRVGQVTSAIVDVVPTCNAMDPALTCGPGYTCALVCDQDSRQETLCYAAGQKEPGEACTDIADCVPGSACFEYTSCSTATQPVKTCRQFCNSDLDCGALSFCNTSVSCDNTSASLRICSRPCTSTAGCAVGLGCFTYAGGITDCACP